MITRPHRLDAGDIPCIRCGSVRSARYRPFSARGNVYCMDSDGCHKRKRVASGRPARPRFRWIHLELRFDRDHKAQSDRNPFMTPSCRHCGQRMQREVY